ncbi:LysR family transcriptional regulator [Conexibacter sp. CPCC 206217]|uniref:LysR family transcriptional regulator n=1 Tax=Conexibacter sp. CPCC 206217 TaxID=3064574 RepID=UPI0027223CC2|nr:LysR family transcriptional regulator [Conexibacter sp. CPCC 206217]MDO8210245.1 LysR family transcriptional regulator [Conexibacter sp. CPCC 206217]
MISSNHLRVFEAVAREGSFGGAAHVLGHSQSTVSHHLAALEEQLGTILFVRSRRGVELTDRGRVLLDHAELILSQLVAAERAVQDSASLREGMLRMSTFGTAGMTFVPRILRAFRNEHPGVGISLEQCDIPSAAVDDVRERRLDVAVVYTTPEYWVRPVPGLSVVRLFSDPFVLLLPAGHPCADRDAVEISELAGEGWITASSDEHPCHRLLMRAGQRVGFEPRIAGRTDDYTVTGDWVAAELGIALIPQLAVPRLRGDLALVPLQGEPVARDVSAIVLGDGSSVAATAFMRHLRAITSWEEAVRGA